MQTGNSLWGLYYWERESILNSVQTQIIDAPKAKEVSNRDFFLIIIQPLSPTVTGNLSLRSHIYLQCNCKVLWDEIKMRYSAFSRARQAALLQNMWTTRISEGEDPLPPLLIQSLILQTKSERLNASI